MAYFDASTKIWSGPKIDHSADYALTFREHLIKSFRSTPEKVFQISDDEGTKLTYKDTEILSIRIGQNLKKFGIKQGDVVAMLMPNSTYVAPITFGCILNGVALAPFLFRQGITPERLEHSLNIAKPKAIFLEEFIDDAEMVSNVIKNLGMDCKIFAVGSDKAFCNANILPFCELLIETKEEKTFELSLDDGTDDKSIVLIIPSSGSTGQPKAIAINGHYWKFSKYFWSYQENPIVATYTNLSWLSGVYALFYPFLNNGLRIISKEKFSAKHFGNLFKTHQVTATLISIEHASILMESSDFNREDFASAKAFYCGGERVPCMVREFLKTNLTPGVFAVVYGSTESGVMCHLDPNKDTSEIKDNIVGVIDPNAICKILDVKTKKLLGPNEVGEIYIKTETMFTGYYGNDELTSKVLDSKGWYKTGDVGYFDDDGALHVHGRVNDMINIEGKMMHLSEFENVFESVKGVKGACVVDLPENILAVLVTLLPGSDITQEVLKKIAEKHFENIKFNGGIHIVDEIPRTNSVGNKVLRSDAIKLALKLINLKKLQVIVQNVKTFEVTAR